MPFAMNFSTESLQGKPPVPPGWYTLRLIGFKQVASKNRDSINLNPRFEIVNHPEYDGRQVFETMNTKGSWVIQDMVHATGNVMVQVQNENAGTANPDWTLPGVWDKNEQFPEEPEKWEYLGPLVNATLQAELYEDEYNGKKSNKVRQFKCVVPGCTERHSTNLAGKSS